MVYTADPQCGARSYNICEYVIWVKIAAVLFTTQIVLSDVSWHAELLTGRSACSISDPTESPTVHTTNVI